ncbi:MAG: HlyD family type I secretion periplasmic adaptor subunit [Desulfovibrio sp.]|nr:HlyD family type I secretion periplasmic adaptor subunit [Desulfovibrio sp.]
MARSSRKICREAMEFQPDAVAVDAGRLPWQARAAVYVMLAALVCGGAWAWLSRVDRVVTARGMLMTMAPAIVVQPLETSIIRTLAVRPGDVVTKGELLATLDPTFASADLGQLTVRKRFLESWIRRLLDELEDRPSTAPDDEAADADQRAQMALFLKRKEEYRANVEAKDQEIATFEEMLSANVHEQERLKGQFALTAEIEGMYRKLWDEDKTSRLEYINALREKLRVEDLYASAAEKNAQIRERLAQARAERQSFIGGWRTQTATQLVEAQQELTEAEHTLAKAARRTELVELSAVSDAVVKDMAKVSEGSVIREAETLFTLIPIDEEGGELEAEAAIPAKDIGHIRPGNAVRMKLMAFPFQRHGFLSGVVRMVSPDVFLPEGQDGGAYYKCRIRLTTTTLRDVGPDFRLLPGMTLDAEILVGKRRVAEYLLDPLLTGLHESLSEP